MDNFDLELALLRDEITRSQQLRARLNSMHPQREYLAEQEAELRAAREEEDGDVERLEGRSLARYFILLREAWTSAWTGSARKPARPPSNTTR